MPNKYNSINMETGQQKKKRVRAPTHSSDVSVELQKAEESVEQQQFAGNLIKTRGQLEEEAIASQRAALLERERAIREYEAARYSKYFRIGLFCVIAGGVAFLGYKYKDAIVIPGTQ